LFNPENEVMGVPQEEEKLVSHMVDHLVEMVENEDQLYLLHPKMRIHSSHLDIEKFSKHTMENLVEVRTNMEQMLQIWNSKYLSELWSKI